MKLRPLTRRIVFLELWLAALGLLDLFLAPVAESYRTHAFKQAYMKLRRLPEQIAGWKLVNVASPNLLQESGNLQGNLQIATGTYRYEETDDQVAVSIAHWYHPVRCYLLHGWEMFRPHTELLMAQDAKDLREKGVGGACFRQPDQEVLILFWESSLTAPEVVRAVPSASDGSVGQSLSRQALTLKRRIQRFLLRGPIVVQVLRNSTTFSASQRDALLRLVRELLIVLPKILS